MEIKAICAHFDWDFESLSSGREKIQDVIDMSTIETKVPDHTDSVAESGSDKELEVDLTLLLEVEPKVHMPTSSLSVPADAISSCPKALDEFNVKAIDLNFLGLVDNFPMEVDQFVRFGGYNVICSATITIFEHSIRLYLMTLHSQQSARCLNRKSAGAQYAIPIMDQLNHLIKCLGNEDFEDFLRFNVVFAPISMDHLLQDAMCHINTTIAEGIPRTYIQLSLPTKVKDTKAALSILHQSFNEKLKSSSNQDSSIIFIDIMQPDVRGSQCINIDFPFIMKRDLPGNEEVIYQTAGAIYWCPTSPHDLFHVSIVTRSRNQLDSIAYSCYEYEYEYEYSKKNEVYIPVMSEVQKSSNIEFPAMKKINHRTYFLKGVIMFLNVLSSLSTTASYELPKYEILRSASETTSGCEIIFKHINSLLEYSAKSKQSSSSCWLDGETIYEVLSSFAAFLGNERNFVMDNDASHGLIQYLLHPKEENDDIECAYDRFKTVKRKTYRNMFSSKDLCVHIAVNEPQGSHWNYALVLVKEKTIIVHDPLYSGGRVNALGNAIFKICCLESGENEAMMDKWEVKLTINHPQQEDSVSCGVFSIMSSMRAMVLIHQNRIKELYTDWKFPSKKKDLVQYRRSFAKILIDDDKEVELVKFVAMFSKP